MILEGIVVGGRIDLAAPPSLPDGTRVRVELLANTEEHDDWDALPPEEPYDREKELAILREAYADAQAGRGVDARAFLKELALKHNFPLEPGE